MYDQNWRDWSFMARLTELAAKYEKYGVSSEVFNERRRIIRDLTRNTQNVNVHPNLPWRMKLDRCERCDYVLTQETLSLEIVVQLDYCTLTLEPDKLAQITVIGVRNLKTPINISYNVNGVVQVVRLSRLVMLYAEKSWTGLGPGPRMGTRSVFIFDHELTLKRATAYQSLTVQNPSKQIPVSTRMQTRPILNVLPEFLPELIMTCLNRRDTLSFWQAMDMRERHTYTVEYGLERRALYRFLPQHIPVSSINQTLFFKPYYDLIANCSFE